ncbi:MAG: HEAT repeat domain-containing protein [Planctomycetes bacterium]|jgi:HEAT repeat protein|nr:HEAT repeat domain-containing protein [Planctomycetota bacterium]
MAGDRGPYPGLGLLALPVLLLAGMAGVPEAVAAPSTTGEEPAARLRALLGDPEAAASGDLPARIAALGPAVLPSLFEEVWVLADDFRRGGTFEAALSAFRCFPVTEVRAFLLAVTADGSPPEATPRALRVLGTLGDAGGAAVIAELCARQGPEALRSPALRGLVVTTLAAAFAAMDGACAGAEEVFAGGSPEFRAAVLDALERIGGPPAVEALLRIFVADPRRGRDAIRRVVRMPVLGVEPEPAGLDRALGSLAEDPDGRCRVLFAMAAARLHRVRSFAMLLPLLEDESGEVVSAAENALFAMSSVRLRGGAEVWEEWYRRETVWRDEEMREDLDRLGAGDPQAVIAALGRLSRRKLYREGSGERIRARLSDDDPAVRSAAARAMARLGDPRGLDALLAALGDADESVRSEAAAALAAVTRLPPQKELERWPVILAKAQSRLDETRRIR